jgi:hypothetical protein
MNIGDRISFFHRIDLTKCENDISKETIEYLEDDDLVMQVVSVDLCLSPKGLYQFVCIDEINDDD